MNLRNPHRPYPSASTPARVRTENLLETLEPRLLFSGTLMADAGADLADQEGQSVAFAGSFTDTGGGGTPGAFDLLSLTSNSVSEQRLRVDGERAVWDDGSDVFFFDGTTPGGTPNVINLSATITGNAIDAQIDGDRIAFVVTGTDRGIYVYDINAQSLTQISSTPSAQDIQIQGDRVVWEQDNGAFQAVLTYNFADASPAVGFVATPNTDPGTSGNMTDPVLEDGVVYWLAPGSGGFRDVFAKDLGTGIVYNVSNTSTQHDQNIRADGGVVTWNTEGAGAVFPDVYVFDGRGYDGTGTAPTPVVLDAEGLFDINARVSGANVVWESVGSGVREIFHYNVDTAATTNLTNTASVREANPDVSGSSVVWQVVSGGAQEVFLYDLDTSTLTQVTSNAVADTVPVIDGSNIAMLSASGTGGSDEVLFARGQSAVTYTFDWDFGDGTVLTDVSLNESHTYADNDAYTVTLSINASDGRVATDTLTATVANADPTLGAVNIDQASIDEGGSVTVSGTFDDAGSADTHTVTIDWGDGTTSAATVNQAAGTYTATNTYADDDPTGTASDVNTIGVTVLDDDAGSANGASSVTVNNLAPTLSGVTVSSATVDEGGSVTLSGSIIDAGVNDTHVVTVQWGDGSTSNATVDQVTGTFTATHTYIDDEPTGTASDLANIIITVTDDDTGVGSDTSSVTVNNLAPVVAAINGPSQAVRGQTLTYTGTFTDAGVNDTHTLLFEVRDAANNVVASSTTGSVTFTPADLGTHTVSLTVTDDDTGVGSSAAATAVSTILVTTDPADPGQTALLIGGGDNADWIRIRGNSAGLRVNVLDLVTWEADSMSGMNADRVIVYGNGGDDYIKVSNSAGTTPTELFGGDGDDWIRGGLGDDTIVGGDGDDFISGRHGRDLLIGGEGSDFVIGNRHDDILIAGTYSQQDDLASLRAIMAEWTRLDADYLTRTSNLASTLNATTVFDDNRFDLLLGLQGQDWFFANDSQDLTDQRQNELLDDTQIDFLENEEEDA